jgi:hypothetical protein
MEEFPRLSKWLVVYLNRPNDYSYVRHDFCIKGDLSEAEIYDLCTELAKLIARFRLSKKEYREWLKYLDNDEPIPEQWKERFRQAFWRGFVSGVGSQHTGQIEFDDDALRGYLGEALLYIIEHQVMKDRIDTVPRQPKPYPKDSGIDSLELCGTRDDPDSLYYIAWEAKGTVSAILEGLPTKICNQHYYETPRTFRDMVSLLEDLHESDPVLAPFVEDMIDDFYRQPPSERKSFGGCITFSGTRFARSDAFSGFAPRFRGILASPSRCRQVRLCAVGDLNCILRKVREKLWNKLLL